MAPPGPRTSLALKMKSTGVLVKMPSWSLTVPVRTTVIALAVARLIDNTLVRVSVNVSPSPAVQDFTTCVPSGAGPVPDPYMMSVGDSVTTLFVAIAPVKATKPESSPLPTEETANNDPSKLNEVDAFKDVPPMKPRPAPSNADTAKSITAACAAEPAPTVAIKAAAKTGAKTFIPS